MLLIKFLGEVSIKRATVPAKSPMSLTVMSVIPLTIRIIIKWIDAINATIHTKESNKRNAPINISKIAVPIIACSMGTGNSFRAHGITYPAQASGCFKIKTPIHKKVIARPILKIWKEFLFIIIMSGSGSRWLHQQVLFDFLSENNEKPFSSQHEQSSLLVSSRSGCWESNPA